jgi:pyruvate/2-oxoglutarate/acetoin dehydrogenase E1 component
MKYLEELNKSMQWLAEQECYFIGQSTRYPGTGLYWTIKDIPERQRIELPVQEDMQMGMSIGMALEGLNVVSIYPRMDFLILALNQLVNHLDKIEEMSDGQFKPRVIIRTAIGSVKPLFPGPQHNQDISEALKLMCKNINIVKLDDPTKVFEEYKKAFYNEKSTILIEIPDLYSQELRSDKTFQEAKNERSSN